MRIGARQLVCSFVGLCASLDFDFAVFVLFLDFACVFGFHLVALRAVFQKSTNLTGRGKVPFSTQALFVVVSVLWLKSLEAG